MLTFIIIFGVALLASLGFIYLRIYKIRKGFVKVSVDHTKRSRKVYTKVVQAKHQTSWYGRNLFKFGLLLFLKLFVFIGFVFKQMAHEAKETLKEKLAPKKQSEHSEPSAFIRTVQDYKKELTKFQKKLDQGE